MNTGRRAPSDPDVVSDFRPERGAHRLLYIEDSQSTLTLIEWILDRETDVELLSAVRGKLGLELAREQQPDLIVLDLHLPDMPGESVLRCLRADVATRHIPVVVLSADPHEKPIKRLLALGARDYLTKPLDIRHLLEVIEANLKPRMTSASSSTADARAWKPPTRRSLPGGP